MELKLEALGNFFDNLNDLEIFPTVGGVNNYCYHVKLNTGERYVLRIYNNGCDYPRVDFEHQVLNELILNKTLSFRVPTPIKSKVGQQSHVRLSNGSEATLFEYIPGELPKKTRAREIGRASGELVCALAAITITTVSPNPRFSDIYKAHHATTREIFFSDIQKPAFDVNEISRKYIELLAEEVRQIEIKIEKLHTLQLPIQLIHADLHYDNVLCDGDAVSGLLDFEFSVHDWRACEIAVALSKYAGEPDAITLFIDFADGYAVHGRLTSDEIHAVPDLIILRVLSNVVYFIGRAYAGEDTLEILISKSETYYTRIKWIHEHRGEIENILIERIKSDSGSLKRKAVEEE